MAAFRAIERKIKASVDDKEPPIRQSRFMPSFSHLRYVIDVERGEIRVSCS